MSVKPIIFFGKRADTLTSNKISFVFCNHSSVSQCIQILKLSLIIAPPLLPRNGFGAPAHLVPVTQTSALHFTLHPAAKRNNKKKTPSDKRLRTSRLFSFSLFFLFVFKCANSQWARRKLQPAQLLERLQTKCARARKNICACTGHKRTHAHTHVRAHTDGYTDGLFMPDLITV